MGLFYTKFRLTFRIVMDFLKELPGASGHAIHR